MQRVQSIDRALNILELLAVEASGLGVTEIGKRFGLPKSTIHRILLTLLEWGYVEKNSDGSKYKLGLKVVDISRIYLNKVELITEAQPYLRNLAVISTQPVHLGHLEDKQMVFLDKVEVVNSIRMYSQVGRRIPFHSSALGKVFVSYLNDIKLQELLENYVFTAMTDKTITDKEVFIKELKKIKGQGYAIDDEENEEGIRCISAPIFDYRGEVVASISTSGSLDIYTLDKLEMLKKSVMSTASVISSRLGYNIY